MPLAQIIYDELPYTCNAMPYAQPDRLATVAILFGMTPPPVQTCRVLELGSCDGSNIIATAHYLPEAECWGVDMSAQHIANGRTLIKALELQNITLKHMNILEVDERFGTFDYIIAHGIYSWVSSEVQEKILSICQHHLATNGVAYVSYNTKPGWNLRSTLRDMMRYHTAPITDLAERTFQLKNLLKFFTDATANSQDAYSQFAREQLNHFSQLPDSFVFQEFIDEENEPLYFYQFMDRARAHGLEYLGDALSPSPAVTNTLHHDLIHQEQMMDFLRNRHFRHTCLCHQGTQLNRCLSSDLQRHFYIPQFVTTVSEYPQASSLARWQAQHGEKVTNRRCEWITIENAECLQLLPYLDGSRDHAALLDLQGGGREVLDEALRWMAQAALLVA